jgi:hypothetical protein
LRNMVYKVLTDKPGGMTVIRFETETIARGLDRPR